MTHWKADLLIGAALVLAWMARTRIMVAFLALVMPRRAWCDAMVKAVHEAEEELKRRSG